MIKILVVSDTHGNTQLLERVVSINRTSDLCIHLGDNASDGEAVLSKHPEMAFLCVSGNCDRVSFYGVTNSDGCYRAEEHRIFYTHGHKYNVNAGTQLLSFQAKQNNADIALYGHTHVSYAKEVDGVLVINPGSISLPRDGSKGSYCLLTVDGKDVKYEIKEVEVL